MKTKMVGSECGCRYFGCLTAIGAGGKITDTKGSLATIGAQPFGTVLLIDF
jgi:hypothetical protein